MGDGNMGAAAACRQATTALHTRYSGVRKGGGTYKAHSVMNAIPGKGTRREMLQAGMWQAPLRGAGNGVTLQQEIISFTLNTP